LGSFLADKPALHRFVRQNCDFLADNPVESLFCDVHF